MRTYFLASLGVFCATAAQIPKNVTNADFTQATCLLDTANAFWVDVLPGFTVSDTNAWPCSYAGTVAGNDAATDQLFFWMYPAIQAEAPLILWLNGGPGASSTFANFLFSSPLRIAEDAAGAFTMSLTEQTWIDLGTVVYIDQPVGTGFSWSSDGTYLKTMEEASAQFLMMLDNIYAEFPDLKAKDVYLTGESYAGHYIPAFANALNDAKVGDAAKYNLKASLVGDPYTAGMIQKTNMYHVPEALNILDDSNMSQIAALNMKCQEAQALDFDTAKEPCDAIMGYIEEISGGVFAYDNRIFNADWDKIEDPVTNYFSADNPNSAEIYKAIHVDASTKVPVFEMSSSEVATNFTGDLMIDYVKDVQKLIDAKSPVLIYAGEFDAQDGPKTINPWLETLKVSESFWDNARKVYWVDDKSLTPGTAKVNAGMWRSGDYLEYLTVPKAGHFVPNNYYSASYGFVNDYITNNQKLKATEATDTDPTISDVTSFQKTFMNDCTTHGTFNASTGKCDCESGFKFADCSVGVLELSSAANSAELNGKGSKWYSMAYSGTTRTHLTLTPSVASDIYIRKGASKDVSNFEYDMSFMNVVGAMTLSSESLGYLNSDGYSVAVYVQANDEPTNKLLDHTLSYSFVEQASVIVPTLAVVASSITMFSL